jgi:hypothetical protein
MRLTITIVVVQVGAVKIICSSSGGAQEKGKIGWNSVRELENISGLKSEETVEMTRYCFVTVNQHPPAHHPLDACYYSAVNEP